MERLANHHIARARWATWLWYELPLLVCMALITGLSSRPSLPGPGEEGSTLRDIFNYGSHMFIYGVLAFLAWRVLCRRARHLPPWLTISPRVTAVLFAFGYGLIDEFHQSFVPGRTASLWDALADLAGATLAMLALGLWAQRHTALFKEDEPL